MNPMSDLLQSAFEQGLLSVEYRPELIGAMDPVPAKFVLYVTIGRAKGRLVEVEAGPYLLDRVAPAHVRPA